MNALFTFALGAALLFFTGLALWSLASMLLG